MAEINLKQTLAALSPTKRALLELKLMKKNGGKDTAEEEIPRRADRATAPLSHNQQGLWVLSQLMPDTWLYQIPKAVRLTGKLNVAAMQKTLDTIIARHESLRTTFTIVDGVPMQMIAGVFPLELPLMDFSHLPESDREAEAHRLLSSEARRPFDLSQGPLIRGLLLRLGEEEHILLVTTHHIVTDGWSMGIFHRELMELYEAFAAGRPSPFPELKIQYADYAVWHRQWFEGSAFESQLAYWKKQFAETPPVLELPTDQPRANIKAFHAYRGTHQTLRLSKELTKQVNEFCRAEEATPFMTLLAAFKVMLHRYTGEEDIVVGSPIAGRCMAETEPLIGLFINVSALRASLSGNPTFRELLARVKDAALGAYANQDLPFETLVRELQPDRTLAHNPIFQVMFVLQNEPIPPLEFGGLTISHVQVDNITTNFDLTLDIVERDGQFLIKFECNADLFEEATISRMMGHFETLLRAIVENPEQTISELPLLTADERHQLLVEWTDTKAVYPHTCIQDSFEKQVAASPDALALVTDEGDVSYRELNDRANRLAHFLRKRGVESDMRVGVCMERSAQMIVALLGILKAGGAYVPLDPAYPQARLQLMIENADVSLLLTEQALAPGLNLDTAQIISFDEIGSEIANESGENPGVVVSADNLAYVMFTSGSTGRPKGVAVTHQNVLRLVKNTNYASFSPDEVFLQYAPISFDASTFEIWGSLLNGARLALMPSGKASLKELGDALKRFEVTTLWLTAGLFHLMVDNHLDDLRGLRQLLAGGDVLSAPHVKKALRELKGCRLINGYGPTENTTFTCCFPMTSATTINGTVPIGKPISNTYVYVLDRHMNPVPLGVPGELYIGGDGLARNYLKRPLLTNEKFVRDPFSSVPNARLYKSGDLVRYRLNGNIEFLGRSDNQVKVRGLRVELGEIEAALAAHPSVRDAIVIARKDEIDKYLAAYLTAREGADLNIDDVRHFLDRTLPGHMVPSMFSVLEEMPLSPSGKVDRGALPSTNGFKPRLSGGFVSPTDELELKLVRIWERVLNVRSVGINDNFFDLGGHSLMAVRLFALIEQSFGRQLPLATLFQAPTIRQLAAAMRAESWPETWSSLVMIQGNGRRTPFFCVHAAGGNVLEYHDLARLLGDDQPFYGLQAKGLNGKEEPHTSIKEMAAHYIKEMREVQPEGPYLIGGRSSGGTIAFEMARQLKAAGEETSLLALFDVYPAGYFKLLPKENGSRDMRRGTRRIHSHLKNIRQLSGGEKVSYLFSKLKYAPAKIRHKVYRRIYKMYQRVGRALPAVLRNIEELNFIATRDYVPQVYAGRATLFSARDLTASYDVEDGWRQLVAELEVHKIPGNHLDIIREPHVAVLAEKLNTCLKAAQEQTVEVR